MKMVYKDKAGNKLYMGGKIAYVKNREGKIVNTAGFKSVLQRAKRSGVSFKTTNRAGEVTNHKFRKKGKAIY